ncbi:MAG: CoA transferase [Proteobacteria bacterium]|nr:CoA transferase [Pseudomonadota bacterium]
MPVSARSSIDAPDGSDCADAAEAVRAARRILSELPVDLSAQRLDVLGSDPILPVRYPLGIAAAGVAGACGLALAQLASQRSAPPQRVRIDLPHAAAGLVSFRQLRLDGRPISSPGDHNPLVGMYRCRDGRWLAIHGGFPSLEAGTCEVLGAVPTSESIAEAIAARDSEELEASLAAHRMCGVVVRTAEEWRQSKPGQALQTAPLVSVERIGDCDPLPLAPAAAPLAGVRVLDFTRILAGPACGRMLAAAGADVLVAAPPHRPNIAAYGLETSQGKRSAWIDIDTHEGHALALRLADTSDVFVDSYRSGALEARGLGACALARRRPGLIYVSINCYGHGNAWSARPGWEMMGQAATGLAIGHGSVEHPLPLWCYPCDYLTGYLAALGVTSALLQRAAAGGSYHVKVSLCRTGVYTEAFGARYPEAPPAVDTAHYCVEADTPLGHLRYLPLPIVLPATPLRFARLTGEKGADTAVWMARA